jgi:hypothetical protein
LLGPQLHAIWSARSRVMQKMQVHGAAHLVHLTKKLGLTMP